MRLCLLQIYLTWNDFALMDLSFILLPFMFNLTFQVHMIGSFILLQCVDLVGFFFFFIFVNCCFYSGKSGIQLLIIS